ncbi:MAG: cell division protein ZapD [Candidatus Competibacteraceae bacterium]|nr:cell division protein ZapD [Candidatus Competibacteraceae bacterium]
MSQTVCYEQPLNERIRALLRLEFLFQQIEHATTCASSWNSRMALQGLFDMLDLTGRNEFKGELLKELERHAVTLSRLRLTPGVHAATLDRILAEISRVSDRIHHHLDTLTVDAVRQTDFLSAIHKRHHVPGGACQFDVPALHHWLQQDGAIRNRHLQEWLEPFAPMREAVILILQLIRDSATPQPEIARRGFFQRGLDSTVSNQLIRVVLSAGDSLFFPEISAGRHRFAIRFLEQPDPSRRATQSMADIDFDLACCTI